MRIDPEYRIETIAAEAQRDALQYVQITTWRDEPVAVVADGFILAVVPVEMEDGDLPGFVHASVFERMRELAGNDDHETIRVRKPLLEDFHIGLGPGSAITFEDGWTAPRDAPKQPYPDWHKVLPTHAEAAEDEGLTVFGIQPRLLVKLSEAIGCTIVTVHRSSNPNQIVVAPRPLQGDIWEPPFGVMMLAKVYLPPSAPVVKDQLTGARS